jgi:NitT/TauT family transport system substrate-binding protein
MTFAALCRTLCAIAVAAASLALPQAVCAADRKVTYVLGYIPDVEMFGAEYAYTEGLFKAEGLDVKLIPAGQGIDQVQMIAAGVADVGITSPENIFAGVEKGESFKIFAAQFQKSPGAITCRKDSGVTTVAQLSGKRIGLKARATTQWNLFLAKNNVPASSIEITPIGANDVSTVIAGRVDCMYSSFAFNEPLLIQKAGVPVNVLQQGSFGLNSQSNSYFVKSSFYADTANQDTLVRLLRAEAKAWMVFFKDPKAAADYMIKHAFIDGLELDQQAAQAVLQVEYMRSTLTAEKGILWLNPAIYHEVAENLNASKVTSKVIDVGPILTTEILERAGMPKY